MKNPSNCVNVCETEEKGWKNGGKWGERLLFCPLPARISGAAAEAVPRRENSGPPVKGGLTICREWGILLYDRRCLRKTAGQYRQRYRSGYNGPDSKTKYHFGTGCLKNLNVSTGLGYHQEEKFF